MPYNMPPEDSVEWQRHGEYEEKDRGEWTHKYRRAPQITAREYLRTCIDAYVLQQRLPVIEAEDSDSTKVCDTESEQHGDMYWDVSVSASLVIELRPPVLSR